MQHIFPEGFVFTNALYGLSWCEYGISDSTNENRPRAIKEALFAYGQINSEKAKSIFYSNAQIENGIFYVGWKNYLLSKILLLDTNFANHEEFKQVFNNQCELIANTLEKSKVPFLQSYTNQSWPADMCVAMASLSNYNKVFEPKYRRLVTEWIKNVKRYPDPQTGMIPHEVNSSTGETIVGARGSSSSLILRLMAEIDPGFAREQYQLYKQYFVSTTFGLPSVNEYPKGQSGTGDIDSGPVIFGVGFAGTIVSMGAYSVLGEYALAENQFKTINSFGMSCRTSETKKYVLGQMPIADAFIAWGRSSGLNSDEQFNQSTKFWRWRFHLISISILTILWLLYYSRTIAAKLRKTQARSI
jgi:hypothetical protein